MHIHQVNCSQKYLLDNNVMLTKTEKLQKQNKYLSGI